MHLDVLGCALLWQREVRGLYNCGVDVVMAKTSISGYYLTNCTQDGIDDVDDLSAGVVVTRDLSKQKYFTNAQPGKAATHSRKRAMSSVSIGASSAVSASSASGSVRAAPSSQATSCSASAVGGGGLGLEHRRQWSQQ